MVEIQVNAVSYQYRDAQNRALENISFTIPSGVCLGLIGPNGAGKSTLLSLLSGLLQPTSGSISFTENNKEILNKKRFIQENIALVPQEYAFYYPLSVLQNLEYFVSLCGFSPAQQHASIQSVIRACQLEKVLKQKSKALSGGYKRRLNLAIALLKNPQILYLDEPTVGVDPVSRKAILALIDSLKKQHKTIIFTSHMLNEIQEQCDDIYILKDGQAFQFNAIQTSNVLSITFAEPLSAAIQTKMKSITGCLISPENTLSCNADTDDTVWQIMQLAHTSSLKIESLQYGQNSLTEHYLKLMEQHDIPEH